MDTATRLKVLTTLTEAVREFWYESEARNDTALWRILGQLEIERHTAFLTHTNALAVAAMREERTRLFADLNDTEFAVAIAHIERANGT